MSFSPAFLDDLRSRLTLSEIAGKRLRLTRAGREFKACCPFHNEKTPSFYINDDKQFFHCFGCGAHGDVIGFTMRYDRLSFPEAVESLATLAGLPVPQDTPQERERFDHEKRLYQLLDRANAWFEEQLFAPAGREALAYLRNRGLNEDAIRRFRLGYAPGDAQALIKKLIAEKYSVEELVNVGLVKKADPLRQRVSTQAAPDDTGASAARDRDEYFSFFRNRVIFPVGDRRGRTVAFGARILGEGEPKYLNSPDHPLFRKGKLLYGLSRARAAITQNQPIVVVEGYMDVIALVEAGYSGAVAPLGTALTEDQLIALWKLLPPFEARDPARDYSPILCFDGDNAGERAAARAMERVIPLLTPAQTVRIATMPEGQDPDDLIKRAGKGAMQVVLEQAKPMIEMIWDTTIANRRLQTPEDRGAFIASLKQRVSRIGNDSLRKLYEDELRKRLAAAFDWSGPAASSPASGFSGGFSGRARGPWRPPQPPLPLINRKQPPGPHKLRERALMALMINYPALFGDFGEDFALIHFENPGYEGLRQQIVAILSAESQEPLDATELYRHLSPQGEGSTIPETGHSSLTEILSEATYMHAAFARPGRSVDEARLGWKSIWSKHLQELLQVDLQAARRLYTEDASDENLTRLLSLREQVEALIRESDDPDGFGAAFPTSQEN